MITNIVSQLSKPALEALPEDILILILTDYIYEPGQRHHVHFSHVCQALRLLALDIPSVWAYIDTDMCRDEVKLYLSRSREAGLTIALIRPRSRRRMYPWWEVVNLVKPVSYRWREFIFDIDFFQARRKFYTSLCLALGTISLPRIERISLHTHTKYRWDLTQRDIEKGLTPPHFYARWDCPSLRSLCLTNQYMLCGSIASVTSLHLFLKGIYNGSGHEVADVLRLLSLSPLLCDLKITNQGRLTSSRKNMQAELNALKTLSMEDCACNISRFAAVDELLTSLNVPNLVQYNCTFMSTRGSSRPNRFRRYTPQSLASVQVFVLRLDGLDFKKILTMESIFHAFPRLHSLTIENALLPITLDLPSTMQTPSVKDIKFKGCILPDSGIVEDLKRVIGVSPLMVDCVDMPTDEFHILAMILDDEDGR